MDPLALAYGNSPGLRFRMQTRIEVVPCRDRYEMRVTLTDGNGERIFVEVPISSEIQLVLSFDVLPTYLDNLPILDAMRPGKSKYNGPD